MNQKMHLAFDLSYTHLDGRWRVPGSWTGRIYPDVGIYEEVARIAERGCIDMIFFGDGTGIPSTWRDSQEAAVRVGHPMAAPRCQPLDPADGACD
jgi:hypothetical protein